MHGVRQQGGTELGYSFKQPVQRALMRSCFATDPACQGERMDAQSSSDPLFLLRILDDLCKQFMPRVWF